MKEFEKWWEKHRASALPHTCQSSRGENLACMADREVWKAALEWVRDNLVIDSSADEIIEQELQE